MKKTKTNKNYVKVDYWKFENFNRDARDMLSGTEKIPEGFYHIWAHYYFDEILSDKKYFADGVNANVDEYALMRMIADFEAMKLIANKVYGKNIGKGIDRYKSLDDFFNKSIKFFKLALEGKAVKK